MRKLKWKLLLSVALISCLLLAVGCGGKSDGTTAPGSTSSTSYSAPSVSAVFVKEADEICRIGTGRRAMIMEEAELAGKVGSGGKETLSQRHRRADLTWTLDQTMLGEFELMKVRPADSDAFKALSEAMEERIASVKSTRSSTVPSPKLDQLIAAYGLKGCTY